MKRAVEILADDWERLRGCYPDMSVEELTRRVLIRGAEIVDASQDDRRARIIGEAAIAAMLRFRLVMGRERAEVAEERERETYEQYLELDKDLVPPLKLEAKSLRAEIRRLEEEARNSSLDPDAVEPRVDWAGTLAVDEYEAPRYATNETRRRTAVEFFRRVGDR